MTWGTTQDPWPDQPDDKYPDFLWPDDDDQDAARPEQARRPGGGGAGVPPTRPVPLQWASPSPGPSADAAERRRRMVALTVTAVVAIGLGAGAELVYRNAQVGSTPPVATSHGTGLTPAQGGGPAGPGSAGSGQATVMLVVGHVTALGSNSVTIGGGQVQSVRAAVTSATRFTGTARTLTAVRVGDTVQAQIAVVNGTAKLVSLQDPANES